MKNVHALSLLTPVMLVLGLLAGCVQVPEYEQPASPVAPFWVSGTGEEQQVDQKALALTIPWQNFFQSPALQEMITLALDNNRDLHIAALNLKKYQAQYRIQRSELYPSVGAGASFSYYGQPENQTGKSSYDTSEAYEVGLASTSWELDLFGRISSLSEAALNTYLAQEEAQKAIAIALIAETANAYLQLLTDQEDLKLSTETLEAQKKSYDLIASGFANGVASKLDVAQVKIAVESARTSQVQYSRLVQQDKNALYLLLGIPSTHPLPDVSGLEEVALLQDIPVGLPSQVLLRRPDIRQAEYGIKAANGNIAAARANFFPKITMTGTLGFASTEMSTLFSSGSAGAWSFLPSIQVPIFTGDRNQATLDSALVDQEIALAQYEQAIEQAFREVADELAARSTLSQQLDAQRQLVAASQEAYDLAYMLYRQGINSFLNVLDAQRSLFEAQQAEIEIKRQHLVNQINLYKALGGGLGLPAPMDQAE